MVRFRVYDKPVTQGSVHAITVNGKPRVIHNKSKELYDQRGIIQSLYHENGGRKIEGAVEIIVTFSFVRPKSVSAKKRPNMIVKPDIDKLARAVLDALTHHAYDDDSQVVTLVVSKIYGEEEYIDIQVEPIISFNPWESFARA